ncbi:hypothetical protein ACFY19_38895 [Streptosporangium saharense]|uniref:hypothetical protein n=1 Tax=Streptosporangium saharense TaxID=1706840 RepID=UPI0036BED789
MSETDPPVGTPAERPGASPVETEGRAAVNEDWAATVVGLVLLALVLFGVIPVGLVP